MLRQQEQLSLVQALRRTPARTLAARAAGYALSALMGCACARSSVLGGMQMAGAPMFAAGMCAGLSRTAMLLGCAAGCISLGDIVMIWPLFACMAVWLMLAVMSNVELGMSPARTLTGRRVQRACKAARGDAGMRSQAALLACAAAAANALMVVDAGRTAILQRVVCALMGFGLVPVMALALHTLPRGARGDAQAAAQMLLACVCAGGLMGLAGAEYAYVALGMATLGALGEAPFAWGDSAGRMRSVRRGVMLGAILGAWAYMADMHALLALACLLAGAAQALSAWGVLAGAVALALIGQAAGMNAWLLGACALAGGAAGRALKWFTGDVQEDGLGYAARLSAHARDERANCAGEGRNAHGHNMAARDHECVAREGAERAHITAGRAVSAAQLLERCMAWESGRAESGARRLSEDLERLSGAELPHTRARELEQLKQRVCEGCDRFDACWMRASESSRAAFVRVHAALMAGEEDATALLPRGCVRRQNAQAALDAAAERARQDEALRRDGLRRDAIQAGVEAAMLNYGAVRRELSGMRVDKFATRAVQRALGHEGMGDALACVTAEDARAYIQLGEGSGEDAPEAARRALMRATGMDYDYLGCEGDVLRLRQRSRLCVKGAVRRCAQDADACGDSALLTRLDDGRWLAAVSDGMGRGERAARESSAAISAISRLLGEGVPPQRAVDIANALLQMSGGDEMYATLDMALIDPESGRADMYKLGAPPSLLVSGQRTRMISASAPPCGILDSVCAAHRSVRLRPGDRLVLMSDGACDFSDASQAHMVRGLAAALAAREPGDAAESLIARMRTRFDLKDDAAVIVMDISARNSVRRHAFNRRRV